MTNHPAESVCAECVRRFEEYDAAPNDGREALKDRIHQHIGDAHPELVTEAGNIVRRTMVLRLDTVLLAVRAAHLKGR